MRFTPLATTVYIVYLFAEICKKWGMFHFVYERLGEEYQKAFSECWNGKWYSYLYQYKTSVVDGNWLDAAGETLKCLNTTGHDF